LDPFCGCGTTITVAQRLDRKWIGIDITHLAINLIKWRMKNAFGLEAMKDYKVVGEPTDLSGARELFSQNRYQFQWWALSLINARPYGDKKKGADTGIDGYIYYMEGKDIVKKVIVQVKGGHVSVSQIRDLIGVMDREKAELSIFITLEHPTTKMDEEANIKGFYKFPLGGEYLRVQILTIEELLKGNKPKLPPLKIPSFKEAERYKREEKTLDLHDK